MKNLLKSIIIFLVLMLGTNSIVYSYEKKDFLWKIHSVTPFKISNDKNIFKIGDFNNDGYEDIYVILKNELGLIEVHVLDGYNNYISTIYNVTTNLDYRNANWNFQIGDYNRDGFDDLYCIKEIDNNNFEVHILDGKNNFQTFLLQKKLPINKFKNNQDFSIGDYNGDHIFDLYYINKYDDNIKVQVLDGLNDYNKFLLNKEVRFEDIGEILRFGVEDYNTDGVPDIYCFKKENDDNLEVDILDGKNNYNKSFLEVPTIMNISNENSEFLIGKGRLNIYCILSDNTLSNKIEVHKFGFKDDIDGKAQEIVDESMKYLNTPYIWGGTTPKGFDCSGFTSFLYKKITGIDIGRSTYDQIYSGKEVSRKDLKIGDLIFPSKDHVCIYIGNGKMIHSPKKGDSVKISDIYAFWKARRIL